MIKVQLACIRVLALATLCAVSTVGCGGGDDDSGSSKGGSGGTSGGTSGGGSGGTSSGNKVSCDIVESGLHYCEEVTESGTAQTGCPMMTGFTQGTGCSMDGVTGTCTSGIYTLYAYDNDTAQALLSSLCATGSGGSGGGSSSGSGGSSSASGGTSGTSSMATCDDLAKCCASITTAAVQTACNMVVSAGYAAACSEAYDVYETDKLCN